MLMILFLMCLVISSFELPGALYFLALLFVLMDMAMMVFIYGVLMTACAETALRRYRKSLEKAASGEPVPPLSTLRIVDD
jgi:hypothetical protein